MAQPHTEAPWLDVMRERLGTKEVKGKGSNPDIVAMFADVGHPEITSDEVAWCAAAMGSALKSCGLPVPPKDVNLLARSYLSYGTQCEPKPGAIAIWPRGKAWQGHVNVVEKVTATGKVICIGGNQSNAVTRDKAADPSDALAFRWPVTPTVKDLRKAGSTEVRNGDNLQNFGLISTFLAPVIAAVKELLEPVTRVPDFSNIHEGLSFWQQVLGGANAVADIALRNPWLAGAVFAGLSCAWVGHTIKRKRVAKARAGVPLSVELAQHAVA